MLAAVAWLGGCGWSDDTASTFTISIASSGTARGAGRQAVSGTYQYFLGEQRITRDLSGEGTRAINVEADQLTFVRVHGSTADSLYRLTISQDGRQIYDSAVVSAVRPILYHADGARDY